MHSMHQLTILLVIPIIFLCKSFLFQSYTSKQSLSISDLTLLPPAIAKVIVLEFPGIVADYIFLNTLTFMGDRVISKEPLTSEEYQKVYKALDLITDLDPLANDPYVLAETTLPWDAGMIEETNQLLLKSAKANPNNHRTYLFLWYNHFHFLKNPGKAAYYLEKAVKVPDAPPYYATLAARMNLYAGKHMQGVLFLEELIHETSDPNQRNALMLRLEALKRMAFLEEIVKKYRSSKGYYPKNLDDLVTTGLIKEIPTDPYGGTFYLLDNGRVYTSSQLVHIKSSPTTTMPSK